MLRFDDLGVGRSAGSFDIAAISDFAEDAVTDHNRRPRVRSAIRLAIIPPYIVFEVFGKMSCPDTTLSFVLGAAKRSAKKNLKETVSSDHFDCQRRYPDHALVRDPPCWFLLNETNKQTC